MTGLDGRRVYLDWNATAPLRPEARAAMLAAMSGVGNPSSVHAEGRAARTIVERARACVAALAGCEPGEVVFTSGATEAASLALAARARLGATVHVSAVEHECVWNWGTPGAVIPAGPTGGVDVRSAFDAGSLAGLKTGDVLCLQAANSETGVVHDLASAASAVEERSEGVLRFCDASQSLGKVDWKLGDFRADFAVVSGHKIGSPPGVGALILRQGSDVFPLLVGGGQEQGRRAGTENVVGIAGFGAAAEAARREVECGGWARVAKLRDELEARLESAAPDLIIMGRGAPRLPNTSSFAVPGWPGETQVMQMDLAGFAVSAGSACSSGKVERTSRVLLAMGLDERAASSALRVSLGPTTTEAEIGAFADAWIGCYRRRSSRAA